MKKQIILVLMIMMLSLSSFAQKSVAVYVTSNEMVPKEINKILGSELVTAITKNENYVAVERTDDFLSQVSLEQGNYDKGLDDGKLCFFGQQFGASNVCVADITMFGEEYYIVARLLDISTAKVWKTSKKTSSLKTLDELVNVSELLADDLFGYTKELSTYAYGDNDANQSFITRIENTNTHTKVTVKYFSASEKSSIGISRETYIVDVITNEQYKLKETANINMISDSPYLANQQCGIVGVKGICEFTLFFERIPDNIRNIKIIEKYTDGEEGWEYKDITLKPYGREGLYVFKYEDTIEEEYNKFLKTLVYKITFQNNKYDAQNIYLNGKFIGKVSAKSTKTFEMSIYEYGKLRAVQAEGYMLYPDEVTWTINNNQQPNKGQEFSVVYH